MSVVSPIPAEDDVGTSPKFAILAALRIAIELASETLRAVYLVDAPSIHRRADDVRRAASIVYLAEHLRLAVVEYEQRIARQRCP